MKRREAIVAAIAKFNRKYKSMMKMLSNAADTKFGDYRKKGKLLL